MGGFYVSPYEIYDKDIKQEGCSTGKERETDLRNNLEIKFIGLTNWIGVSDKGEGKTKGDT